MSGIFKVGQMVSVLDWHDDNLELYDAPAGRLSADDVGTRVIGTLKHGDVALVVATERTDGGCVYVIGPNGGGWAFGAFLNIVRQTQ